LGSIGAEMVEIDAASEEDFGRASRDADALYAKGRKITKKIIDGLERCRVISLGSVGVDSVDVAAATPRGRPRDQLPGHVHRGGGRPRDDAAPRRVPPAHHHGPDGARGALARGPAAALQ